MTNLEHRWRMENALLARQPKEAARVLANWTELPTLMGADGPELERMAALAASLGYWRLALNMLALAPRGRRGDQCWGAVQDYAMHMRRDVEGESTHPWFVHHMDWETPQLFPPEVEGAWMPFAVHEIEEGVRVRLLVQTGECAFGEAELDWDEFISAWTEYEPGPLRFGVGDYGELVRNHDLLRILFHDRRPFSPEHLPPLRTDLFRLMRRNGLVQGDSLVERLVRGEEEDPEEAFDRCVEQWHTQDKPEHGVYLSDFLGMMPQEYVELLGSKRSSAFWEALIADRKERWEAHGVEL